VSLFEQQNEDAEGAKSIENKANKRTHPSQQIISDRKLEELNRS